MKLSTILAVSVLTVSCLHNVRAQTAAYPGAIATDANLKVAVNGVSTLLTSSINAVTTILSVSACAGIVPNVLITIGSEIMPVSGCTGTVLVVGSRGFDGTTAATHAATTPIFAYVDAWHHNGLKAEVEAIETALGTNLSNTGGAGNCPSNQAVTGINIGSVPTCAGIVNTFNTRGGAVTLAQGDVAAVEQDLRTTASPAFAGLTVMGNNTPAATITQTGSNYALTLDSSAGAGAALHLVSNLTNVVVGQTNSHNLFSITGASGSCTLNDLSGLVCDAGNAINSINYISPETGSNNAIAGTLTYAVGVGGGLIVQIQLAHSLQAGANTFNYAGTGAVAIKSCRNPANNIATAYAATGTITLSYNAANTVWCDVSQ